MKNAAFLITFAAAVVALAFGAAAFGLFADGQAHSFGLDLSPHFAVSLAVMRANLTDLTKRAAEKLAQATDDKSESDLRNIEEAHSALLSEIDALREEISTAERTDERVVTIRSIAAEAGLPGFGEAHVSSETPADEFRALLIDELARRSDEHHISSNARVATGDQNSEARAQAITNALLHRFSPATIELTAHGRSFRGMSLLEIGRSILEANGVSTRGLSRQEAASQVLQNRSGGFLTTSDFPGILANVANSTLRAAYAAAPQTFRPLVRVTSVSDFKPVTRLQLGEAPALNKVNEHGEFKRGSLGEGKESYKIATYGKIIGITRQVIINDDLDAFTRIPQMFGVQAAQLESDLVWAQILANPTMGDGVALFHSSHGNVLTASSLDLEPLSEGRTAFAMQRGLDNRTVLGLTPAFLIVPVALQTRAEQLMAAIYSTRHSDVTPSFIRQMQLISDARLDFGINRPEDDIVAPGSSTAWFMAGAPGVVDLIELAYLEGNQGVYTETRAGFDIDGVEIKARLDVGAKVLDWRNIARNTGG